MKRINIRHITTIASLGLSGSLAACSDPCVDDGFIQTNEGTCPVANGGDPSTSSDGNTSSDADSSNDDTPDPTTGGMVDGSGTTDGTDSSGTAGAATCEDGEHNGDETDVDCGGGCDVGCDDGEGCMVDDDCMSEMCGDDGTCVSNSCRDGVQNGMETGVDCGNECEPCDPGDSCDSPEDCTSGVCDDTMTCANPACDDGVPNGDETDVDCGNSCGPTCETGETCDDAADCVEGVCDAGTLTCTARSCDDGVLNGDETDVDCGNSCGPTCETGETCDDAADCISGVCDDLLTLTCSAPACDDGLLNGDETDVDCGNSCGSTCETDETCDDGADCISGVCDPGTLTCSAPACDDGVLNGDETDVDCGNSCGSNCETDETCDDGADCISGVCDLLTLTCSAPVCGDGVLNGAEECDDGDGIDNNDCTNACLDAVCGDGIIWAGVETCDDGNTDPMDGCSATCTLELPDVGQACDDAIPPNCFPAVFMATGSSATAGNLYAASLDGATTIDIGPLAVPLTAMAFHPNGTLYAITSTAFSSPDGTGQLGTVDTETAIFTPIGLIGAGVSNHPSMPDMTFIGDQLVGWTESGDDIALIDTTTAAVTVVPSPQGSAQTGLAYNPGTDELFVAPSSSGGTLFTVDDLGNVTAVTTLGGVNGAVKGMAFREGVLYGFDTSNGAGAPGNLVTYDTATGAMTVLAGLPGPDLDGLAVYDPDNVVVVAP